MAAHNNNGRGGMSEVDVLRAENHALRQQLQRVEQSRRVKDQHATMTTQYLCGVLFKQGWDTYKLTGEDMEACFKHNQFRVHAGWEDDPNGEHRNVTLTLVKVTADEQAAIDAAEEAAQAEADAAAEEEAKAEADVRALVDLLALVGKQATVDQVLEWTPMQRKMAEKWASDVHLAASDNDVTPPACPMHVQVLPDVTDPPLDGCD